MNLNTNRLILRPWREDDAPSLYKYAKDPLVGPSAGWPVHTDVENSREIIQNVLSSPLTYAVVLKETNEPIGSIGLKMGDETDLTDSLTEAEIGYWLGVPYWGVGLIPEAVDELLRFGFETLNLECVWYGYFSHNKRSQRAQEKCGFVYDHTITQKYYPLIDQTLDKCVTKLTKEHWLQLHMKKDL